MRLKDFWIGMRMLFALTVFVFLLSCSSKIKHAEVLSAPEIPADWRWYAKPNYSIRYPEDWELRENFEGADVCLFSPLSSSGDLFHESVSVVTENLVRAISLEKYAAMAIHTVGMEYKAKAVIEKKYILDGQSFYGVSFQNNDGWFQQHYYMIKRKAYIVTFWYQPEETEKIKTEGIQIIRSFKLLQK